MDDIYAIRRRNLNWLCYHKEKGNQSDMGKTLGLAPSLVNRYLRRKKIGDLIAKAVCKAYRLEAGWLDNVHPDDRESRVLNGFRKAPEPVKSAIEGALGATDPIDNAAS